MCPSPFNLLLQPEWKREFEWNEISAGPRIWLLCSGEGIKLIKGSNESQRQTRKEGEQWLLHTQLPQAVELGYFFHQCFQSPLFEFSSLSYCGAALVCAGPFSSSHQPSRCFLPDQNWWISLLIHMHPFLFLFLPSRLFWPVPNPGARKDWHRSYSDINDSFLAYVHLAGGLSN